MISLYYQCKSVYSQDILMNFDCTVAPSYKANPSVKKKKKRKKKGLIRGMNPLAGDKLVVFYYLNAS